MAYNGQGQGQGQNNEYGGHPLQDMPAGSTVSFGRQTPLNPALTFGLRSITCHRESMTMKPAVTCSTTMLPSSTTTAALAQRHPPIDRFLPTA